MKIFYRCVVLGLALMLTTQLSAQMSSTEANLMGHIDFLTSRKLMGRKAGSDGELQAAKYIYGQFKDRGLILLSDANGQDFTIVSDGDSLKSRNIVGVVEGYDPVLKNEYIVIGANMDNIGTNLLTVNGEQQLQVFPGADANASGVACLIELAGMVANSSFMFKRSVVFVAFGAKEEGMAGSWYFVNRSFAQKDDISMMVDLNMVGRSGNNNYFTYFTGIPNSDISNGIRSVSDRLSFMTPVQGYGTMPSSDYMAFYEQEIPVTLFTTGVHSDYHSIRDDAESLDYGLMEGVCEYVFAFLMEMAGLDEKVARPLKTQELEEGGVVYSPYDVDKTPEFFRGDERSFLEKWVYTYLKYPQEALVMGVQGIVTVDFIVEADGSVTNVKVSKGVDPDLDKEAVRVISASPKWRPAIKNGEKVRVKYSLPVEFRLKKR